MRIPSMSNQEFGIGVSSQQEPFTARLAVKSSLVKAITEAHPGRVSVASELPEVLLF
jgi:hypothetical protein